MREIDLTLEKLQKLRLPRLDPAALPFEAIRRDLSSASFDWLPAAEEALLRAPDTEPDTESEARAAEAWPAEAPAEAPAVRPLQLGPFAIYHDAERLWLFENGTLRWGLATTFFGGAPVLEVTGTAAGADVALRDAYYPGTLIPASLKVRIRKVGGTWMVRLRLEYGGFDATLALSAWLNGWALSVVHLDLEACPLGPASGLVAAGLGLAAFTPRWVLGTMGAEIFRLDGYETDVTAGIALVVPLRPGLGPEFFLPLAWRRTGILFASARKFPLQPVFEDPLPRVHLGSFRFDSLALEAGLRTDGRAGRVLFASGKGEVIFSGLEPGADLWGSDGEPFRIPLLRPLYGEAYVDRERVGAAFLARSQQGKKVWLHSPGQSLLLDGSSTAPAITILEEQGKPLQVNCRLRLRKTAPRVEGMLVRPRPAPDSEMIFSWRPLRQRLQPRVGKVEIDAAAGVATVLLPRNTSLAVVRRDDFLALGFEWFNRRFESRGTVRRLVPQGESASHLAVVLPPQSIGEEALYEVDEDSPAADSDMPQAQKDKLKTSSDPLPLPPVKALLAKPSRLVFHLPDEFPLDGASLLDWQALNPSLAPTALPGAVLLDVPGREPILLPGPRLLPPRVSVRRGIDLRRLRQRTPVGNLQRFERVFGPVLLRPQQLDRTTTQIEMPFRLILSPNEYGSWVHAAAPVARGGRTELWHTRLAVRSRGVVVDEPHPFRTVRAIWARDYEMKDLAFDSPFLMPLDQDDRWQLVDLTSNFTTVSAPEPVTIHRLMLSALGGWLDSDYRHPPPSGSDYSIEQWRHRATMGRDQYVRVVYKGFLCPLGHRASLVKISERKIQLTPEGDPAAYLRQRMFLVCREPERCYSGSAYDHDGREIPLERVRITTLVTPNLDPPQDSPLGPPQNPPIKSFWPRVGQSDFLFHLKAWDREGHEIDFLMPLAFVRSDAVSDLNEIDTAVGNYNASVEAPRREVDLGGQQLSFAESEGEYEGKTTFDTAKLRLEALPPADDTIEPPFYPGLVEAEVAIAALRQMTPAQGNPTATVEIHSRYLDHGFHGTENRAGLFLDVPVPPALDYKAGKSADRAGGVATPSMMIHGLSRELGAVGDSGDAFAKGTFNPQQFFYGAELLGGISLADILKTVSTDFLERTPKLVTTQTADQITTELRWKTGALRDSGGFVKTSNSTLELASILKTDKSGSGDTSFQLEGALTDFKICLSKVIEVDFKAFRFSAVDGEKPDVHVDIRSLDGAETPVRFTGALEFVNEIQKVLGPANFADPPYLDVTTKGITAGYDLTIPSVAVGVFSLQNLALGARLTLPFTGDPMRLRFNVSERHDPFIVSVAPFGGGGFFALAVGLDGVEALEASIEFGGNVSINLGAASGGVSVMAGIYLALEITTDQSELTGYLRANGQLSVLGLISISMEFYLGLTYDTSSRKAWGEARVTVEVEVMFFSASVTVTMRRQFAGSSGDPPFRQLMPQPRWAAYAAAFS